MSGNLKLLADALDYYASLRGMFYTYFWSRNTPPILIELKLLHSKIEKRWYSNYNYVPSSDMHLSYGESVNLISILTGYTGTDEHIHLTIQLIKNKLKEPHFDYLEQLQRLGLLNEHNFFRRVSVPLKAVDVLKMLSPEQVKNMPDLIDNLFFFNEKEPADLHCELLVTAFNYLKAKDILVERNLIWMSKVVFHFLSADVYWRHKPAKIKTLLRELILPLVQHPMYETGVQACIAHERSHSMTLAFALLKPHFELFAQCEILIDDLLLLLKDKNRPDEIAEQILLLIKLDKKLITMENIKLLINALAPSAEVFYQLAKASLPSRSYEKYLLTCDYWCNFKELLMLFNEIGIYTEANIASTYTNSSSILIFLKNCKGRDLLKTPEASQSLLNIITKFKDENNISNELLRLVDNQINILGAEHYKGSWHRLQHALNLFKNVTQPVFNILIKVKDPYETGTQLQNLAKKHPALLGKEMTDLIEESPQDATEIIVIDDTMHTMHILDAESIAMISQKLKERTLNEKLTAPLAQSIFNKNGKLPSLDLIPAINSSYQS